MIRLAALLPLLLALHVSGFVRDGSVDIAFPEAVRFAVNLTIPATQVTSAALTISPEGQPPITVMVDVVGASVYYGEPEARLIYVWPLTADQPLPLFGSVAYQWTFTAADGSSGTLTDSFVFNDTRFEWLRSTDPQGQFDITIPRALSALVEPLRRVHALLEKNTGRSLPYNLMLYDQPSGCGYASLTDQVSGSDVCRAFLAGYQVLERPTSVGAEDYFVGELVRAAYAPLWEGKNVPAWFVDGLAQFYAPSPKNALLLPAQAAARGGTLYSLRALMEPNSAALWRAQSFGMVLYIANALTPQGLFDLARADDFDAAYQSALGVPLSTLIPAWQQWIFTRAAESVYGITPYQPPTVVPSPTVTPSATPSPTLTPSLTPSRTPTLTLTPRGVRTYEPPPTLTPSATATPLPPTVTPRPPGSLPTASATPTALQVTVAQPAFQAGIGTFLVLLLLLLVYLTVRLGNRR